MKKSLELLEQILEIANAQEQELNAAYIKQHKALRTLGESSLLFHLKALKELIIEEAKAGKFEESVDIRGKNFLVALADHLL
jgi:hypothetical protein